MVFDGEILLLSDIPRDDSILHDYPIFPHTIPIFSYYPMMFRETTKKSPVWVR
jgi:hypothetical protein